MASSKKNSGANQYGPKTSCSQNAPDTIAPIISAILINTDSWTAAKFTQPAKYAMRKPTDTTNAPSWPSAKIG